MLTIGVNPGFYNTKYYAGDNNYGVFHSTYRDGFRDLDSDSIKLTVDGKDYSIGVTHKASYSVDLDKVSSKAFLLPLYAAIAKCMLHDIEEVNLITGLPLISFGSQQNIMQQQLQGQIVKVRLDNGPEKTIILKNVLVYPEAAGYYLLNKEIFEQEGSEVLIIDIGGLTVNTVQFQGKQVVNYNSYKDLGMYALYTKLAEQFKNLYKETFTVFDMERTVKRGELYIENKPMNQGKYLREQMQQHVTDIINIIQTDFPYKRLYKVWMGGGSTTLKDFIPNAAVSDNTIYDNAKIFYLTGVKKYGEEKNHIYAR